MINYFLDYLLFQVIVIMAFFGGGVVRLLALRPLLAYCASLGW
jgi:hypothetical protein